MPFWHPSVRTYVKVVRVKINDSNVATILGSSLLTDGCRRGVQTWTRPHIRVSALFLFLPSPVAVRTGHLPLSHLEGGVGEEARVRPEGTRGGSRSGWFAELSSRSSQLLVHVQKLWCACMRVCVSIRALTSAAVCDFVFISSGGLLSCCSFFPFPSSSSASSSCLCWHLVLCAWGPLWSDHGWELLRVSCTASISEFPLHLGNSAQTLFYFQQCFKFRRKDIHALFLIAHLCLPCYFCHFNFFFFFGFQSSFGMKCY